MTTVRNVAVITGAGSGIGRAIARALSAVDFDLILIGRDQQKLQETKELCLSTQASLGIKTLSFDLTHTEQIPILASQILDRLGSRTLAALINNSGQYFRKSILQTEFAGLAHLFAINFYAPVELTRGLLPRFLEQKEGHIINISSTLGSRPVAETSAYSASKAALQNWTKTLAQEMAHANVRANCILPGIIDTPIHGLESLSTEAAAAARKAMDQLQPLGRRGQPQDIADAVQFLLRSNWITGAAFEIDGGIHL